MHLGGMRVDVAVREEKLEFDYPARESSRVTPLEGVLASLAACAANSMRYALAKHGAQPEDIEVEAHAERGTEHPMSLSRIELLIHLRGLKIAPETMFAADKMAHELCPVLSLLRPGVEIEWRVQVEEQAPARVANQAADSWQ
jgi:uncharacterized OsmC-like protein